MKNQGLRQQWVLTLGVLMIDPGVPAKAHHRVLNRARCAVLWHQVVEIVDFQSKHALLAR